MQFPTEAIRQRVVMYCAHIRRVTKKEEAPHYIIDGNANLRYNDNCKMHEYHGNTTVRRRVLAKLKVGREQSPQRHKRRACRERP